MVYTVSRWDGRGGDYNSYTTPWLNATTANLRLIRDPLGWTQFLTDHNMSQSTQRYGDDLIFNSKEAFTMFLLKYA